MKKIIIATITAVAVTILLLSAANKPQIQAEQPERTQPIITTAAVTTASETKEIIITTTTTAKLTTSITTTAPPVITTATTTTRTTTSKPINTTTAPTTIAQTDKTETTTQPPIKETAVETTPENGTIKGDMIYIIGFGWVKNEGGGGEGIQDHEMKTNGNKIGSFGSDRDEKTPANGTVKGDKIYVYGFGWIDYEGGGGIGEVNEQMYQNGNKIGYFG